MKRKFVSSDWGQILLQLNKKSVLADRRRNFLHVEREFRTCAISGCRFVRHFTLYIEKIKKPLTTTDCWLDSTGDLSNSYFAVQVTH